MSSKTRTTTTATSNGLPSLIINFKAAARELVRHDKRGSVGLILRDAAEPTLLQISRVEQIPKTLSQENILSITRALEGSSRGKPRELYVSLMPITDAEGTGLAEALARLEGCVIDYLAGPDDLSESEASVLADWVLDQRARYRPVKAVLPNESADHLGIVNFATEGIRVGALVFSAAAYCGRIAGILAGVPSGSSSTYAALHEITALPPRSTDAQTADINAGKLILLHDGKLAKIARGVNSKTSIGKDEAADWTKIKIVEGMDLVTYFVRTTIENEWLGVYANSYANKQLLCVAITSFLLELEALGVLQAGSSFCDLDLTAQEAYLRSVGVATEKLTEQQLRAHDTGSFVFLAAGGRFLDAMEDFKLLFHNQ